MGTGTGTGREMGDGDGGGDGTGREGDEGWRRYVHAIDAVLQDVLRRVECIPKDRHIVNIRHLLPKLKSIHQLLASITQQ